MIAPPRDLDELCQSVRKGSPPRLLLFWGHQPSRDGGLGKEWNGLNLLGFALMQARAQLASAG